MHKAYLGQKQFSIEGLDMTVPMLDEMIQLAAANGAREVVIGMAHRGRLNVLAHNLGRAYETIFREFEGASSIEAVTTIPQGGTGDVKYHHGAQGTYQLPDGDSILVQPRVQPEPPRVRLAGRRGRHARGRRPTRQGPHAHLDTNAAVPIILHGDAAFPGQGVVAETLNLQALDGYKVGGTLHLIQNNQVGFTTDPDDARSTRWASDLAKGFDVPIIHVNADDVAACIAAVRLAFAFRQEFGHDVVIDLIGYRRFGHNEADEPAYTQPEMYAKIKGKTRVRDLFAEQLVEQRRDHQGGGRRSASRRSGTGSPSATRSSRRDQGASDAGSRAADAASTSSTARRRRRSRPPVSAERLRAQRGAADGRPRASPSTPSSSSSSSAGARRSAPRAASTGRTPRRSPSRRC